MYSVDRKYIPFPDSEKLETKYALKDFFENLFFQRPYDQLKMQTSLYQYDNIINRAKNLDSTYLNDGSFLADYLKKRMPKLIEDFKKSPGYYEDIEMSDYLEDLQRLLALAQEVSPDTKQ